MAIHTTLYASDKVPAALSALLPDWRALCFPDAATGIVWAEADWQQWVFDEGTPVSTLKIIARTVIVAGTPVSVGGIANVMTPPALQGHGYASAAMRAAADFLRDGLGVPFGLLGCHPHRVSFYARLGWREIPAQFSYAQPDGRTNLRFPWQDVVMILPLANQPWPPGDPVDFNGLPW
jgi:GNAT superfamily N-acetyltransferase